MKKIITVSVIILCLLLSLTQMPVVAMGLPQSNQETEQPTAYYCNEDECNTQEVCAIPKKNPRCTQVYAPQMDTLEPKVVIFLHGWKLIRPRLWYRDHIAKLTSQGYFVFYPSYQPSPKRGKDKETGKNSQVENALKGLKSAFVTLNRSPEFIKAFPKFTAAYKACDSSKTVLLSECKIHTFLYGHSLGGFFALSWPYFFDKYKDDILQDWPQKGIIFPEQIIASNPVSWQPKRWEERKKKIPSLCTGSDYFLSIYKTGQSIPTDLPVAILHSKDDQIAPIEKFWPEKCWDRIKSKNKKMYMTKRKSSVPLWFKPGHMQAATKRRSFTNDLDKEFIWPAVNLAFSGELRADALEFSPSRFTDEHNRFATCIYYPKGESGLGSLLGPCR